MEVKNSLARRIGPATRCGKKHAESAYRQKLASAGVVFRYTSTMYAMPVNA